MGSKQLSCSDERVTTTRQQSKWAKFLAEMEVVMPWQELIK